MILLADASVWEEVVARVMFIGIPLLFLNPSKKWNLDRFKILLGGKGKFGISEVVLILISSSFFGLAHIGWGPWKVLPTFVTGALFGYLYIKVGLHAAIAMHFLFDYDGFIYDLIDYPYYQLYSVYYFALLSGGFFLSWIMVRFKHWMENRSGRSVDRKWILIAHSTMVMLLVAYVYVTNGITGYTLVLVMVPFLNAGGLLLERGGLKYIPEFIVGFSSFLSLAFAPIGLMWIMERNLPDKGPVHDRTTV
jgi:hypothetical protein